MKTKNLFLHLVVSFLIVVAFTILDWFVHQTSIYLSVPNWYFTNKLIFGTIYVFLVSYFIDKFSPVKKAFFTAFVTTTLLQIRYAAQGYALFFHSIVYPSHLVILFFVSWFFLYFEKKFLK